MANLNDFCGQQKLINQEGGAAFPLDRLASKNATFGKGLGQCCFRSQLLQWENVTRFRDHGPPVLSSRADY